MWLEAGVTSSDPKVIAGYFIKTVESVGGVPVRIRADFGTENRSVEQMQVFLREKEDAPLESAWLYGTSQLNQRIESWW
jgi:glucan biosynthesis protein